MDFYPTYLGGKCFCISQLDKYVNRDSFSYNLKALDLKQFIITFLVYFSA